MKFFDQCRVLSTSAGASTGGSDGSDGCDRLADIGRVDERGPALSRSGAPGGMLYRHVVGTPLLSIFEKLGPEIRRAGSLGIGPQLRPRVRRTAVAWISALLLAVCPLSAIAEDLGVVGPTYPIAEHDAIAMLKHRLVELQANGGLAAIERRARQRALHDITSLPPVPGISTVSEYSSRLIDPTVTYAKPVTNDEGAVIVAAGTRINPLDIVTLHERLVFFDGRDASQVKAVQALAARSGDSIKPILTAGAWLELTKSWKRQVYFDQQGRLSQRFGITRVPAVISQRGNQLLLEEEPAAQLR
ncbi:type-F conjugative transfer system protein TraW [Burkholderia sp. Ed8]|uniref:type-F conjugative transfer system protein TraW n=1 Tax=Burkholderia sp. Ed8 TaxID=3112957 RepID=UPI00345D07A9